MFRINSRTKTEISTNYIPITEKIRSFYVYKYIKEYNKLDHYITKKSVIQFKKELKAIYMYRPINYICD